MENMEGVGGGNGAKGVRRKNGGSGGMLVSRFTINVKNIYKTSILSQNIIHIPYPLA